MKERQFGKNQFILMFFAFSFGMILSNLIGQKNANAPKELAPREVLLTYRGYDKYVDDLPAHLVEPYRALESEYQHKQHELLISAGLYLHIENYALQQNIDMDKAAEALFELSEPDEQQVREFYYSKAAFVDKPFYEVKPDISRYLKQRAAASARLSVLNELMQRGDLVLLPDS